MFNRLASLTGMHLPPSAGSKRKGAPAPPPPPAPPPVPTPRPVDLFQRGKERRAQAASAPDPVVTGSAAPLSDPRRSALPPSKSGTFSRIKNMARGHPHTGSNKALIFSSARSREGPATLQLPAAQQVKQQNRAALVESAHLLAQRVDTLLATSLAVPAADDSDEAEHTSRIKSAWKKVWPSKLFEAGTLKQLVDDDPHYKQTKRGTRKRTDHSAVGRRTLLNNVSNGLDELKRCQATFDQACKALAEKGHACQEARQRLGKAESRLGPWAPAQSDAAALGTARQGLKQAREELATLEAEHAHLDATVAVHEHRLDQAARGLHAAVTLGAKLDIATQTLATDLLHRKVRFVTEQVDLCQQRLHDTPGAIDDLHALHQGLQAKVELSRMGETDSLIELRMVQGELAQLEKKVARQEAELHRLRSRLAGDDRLPALSWEMAQQLDSDKLELQLLRELVPEASKAYEQHRHQAQHARTELELFMCGSATQLASLTKGDAQLSRVAEELDQRVGAARELAERSAAFELTHEERAIEAMVAAPPGFHARDRVGPDAVAFKDQLQRIADRLEPDLLEEERTLPRLAKMEIISRAVANVVGGDPGQGAELLRELMSHPSQYWTPHPPLADAAQDGEASGVAAPGASAEPSPALVALFHKMAKVPRGMELLNEIGSLDGDTHGGAMLDKPQLEALHAYWLADIAHNEERDRSVQAWLSAAMKVATYVMRQTKEAPEAFDINGLSPDDRIAFRAVTKGLLSNAAGSEYDKINQALRMAGEDWLASAKDERSKYVRWLPRSPLGARAHPTPYERQTVKMANKALEQQGMPAVSSEGHQAVARAASRLSDQLTDGGMRSVSGSEPAALRQAELFDVTAQVLCDYIARQSDAHSRAEPLATAARRTAFQRASHLHQAKLDKHDFALIRREVQARYARGGADGAARGPARLIKPNPAPAALPPLFEQMFGAAQLEPMAALRQVSEHLSAHLDADTGQAMGWDAEQQNATLDEADRSVRIAQRKQFETKADIVDFYAPLLRDLRLRNQLLMAGGGEIGVGVPLMPWSPVAPFVANVNVNVVSHKNEASLQIKRPSFATEFVLSQVDTTSHDAKGTFGLGWSLGLFRVAAPAFGLKYDQSQAATRYTVLRLLSTKNPDGTRDEEGAREASVALFDTLVRWDAPDKHPGAERGERFAGPLEAILALHPEVLIGSGKRSTATRQVAADVSAAARLPFAGGAVTQGVLANVAIKRDWTNERVEERTAQDNQRVHDRSHQNRTRVTAGFTVGGLVSAVRNPVNPDTPDGKPDKHGSWRLMGALNFVDSTRELWQHSKKTGVTRFAIGDRSGGSRDRADSSPKQVLDYIKQNEEEIYMRFLETVPVPKGSDADTPENRRLAASSLQQLKRDLEGEAKKNPNASFGIKKELKPQLSGKIDALNAIEALALQDGDQAAADECHQTKGDLMKDEEAWSFKNIVWRSKGKLTSDGGIDFVVRAMLKRTVETQMAVTSYG
ncbi:MAG: hypothetical protein V4754_16330 [Pseudomonadota bacterium]